VEFRQILTKCRNNWCQACLNSHAGHSGGAEPHVNYLDIPAHRGGLEVFRPQVHWDSYSVSTAVETSGQIIRWHPNKLGTFSLRRWRQIENFYFAPQFLQTVHTKRSFNSLEKASIHY